MANKIVVTGANVTVVSSDGASSIQPAPADVLETIQSLFMAVQLISYSDKEFPGSVKAVLKNKDDDITKEYSFSGKNGVGWADQPDRRRLNVLIELRPALAEAVNADTAVEGNYRYSLDITPTNYSTGKLIFTFSGGVPDSGGAGLAFVMQGIGGTQASTNMIGKNAGHMSIEVEFSCVAI